MDNEKRTMSWQEFKESGFDGREYKFPEFEGTVETTLVCKRWGTKNNLFAYCDADDGRKIITSAWSEKKYLGLAGIPLGTRLNLTFQRSAKGRIYLTKVERIQNAEQSMNAE